MRYSEESGYPSYLKSGVNVTSLGDITEKVARRHVQKATFGLFPTA